MRVIRRVAYFVLGTSGPAFLAQAVAMYDAVLVSAQTDLGAGYEGYSIAAGEDEAVALLCALMATTAANVVHGVAVGVTSALYLKFKFSTFLGSSCVFTTIGDALSGGPMRRLDEDGGAAEEDEEEVEPPSPFKPQWRGAGLSLPQAKLNGESSVSEVFTADPVVARVVAALVALSAATGLAALLMLGLLHRDTVNSWQKVRDWRLLQSSGATRSPPPARTVLDFSPATRSPPHAHPRTA